MKYILFAILVFPLSSTGVFAEDARDWKLADKSTVTGSLESVEIVIRLPNGITKNVPISELVPEEQRELEKWIANQAKKAAKVKPNGAAAQGGDCWP